MGSLCLLYEKNGDLINTLNLMIEKISVLFLAARKFVAFALLEIQVDTERHQLKFILNHFIKLKFIYRRLIINVLISIIT